MPFEYRSKTQEWMTIEEEELISRVQREGFDAEDLRLNLVRRPGKSIALVMTGCREQVYRYVEATG